LSIFEVEIGISPREEYRLHRYTGYSIRSLVYTQILRASNASVDIHKEKGLKPFRVTPIFIKGNSGEVDKIIYAGKIDPNKTYFFKITLLGNKLFSRSSKNLFKLLSEDTITLDNHVYNVVSREFKMISIEGIASESDGENKITVNYLTPTYFRAPRTYNMEYRVNQIHRCKCIYKENQDSIFIPLPLPTLFLKNILRIYHKYIEEISEEQQYKLRQYINEDGMVISGFPKGIRTWAIKTSRYEFNIGFTGRVNYHLRRLSFIEDVNIIINNLKKLILTAQYTNVGGNRTAGFGWIKTNIR